MIVSVFGASSRTGRLFIPVAAAAGVIQRLHYRTAPEEPSPDTATVVVGSLSDPTAVREVLRGSEVAICLLGPHASATRPFTATVTKAIIAQMKVQQVPRLICVTGAMVGDQSGNVSMALRVMAFAARRTSQSEQLEDRDHQERIVRGSKLTWTVVKPPRLGDGDVRQYAASAQQDVGVNSQCSRAALARFLLDEAQTPRFGNSAVYVVDRAG